MMDRDTRTDRLLDVLELVGLALSLEVAERTGARPPRRPRRRGTVRGTKVQEARDRGGRYWVDPYLRELPDGRRILNRGHWRRPPRERPRERRKRNPEGTRTGNGAESREDPQEAPPWA